MCDASDMMEHWGIGKELSKWNGEFIALSYVNIMYLTDLLDESSF